MSISYCGVPLCLPDAERELTLYLEQTLPLEDMRLWGEKTAAERAGNVNTTRDQSPRIGLPLPNWPAPPQIKLNTLWWPVTGATRWARGLFLASGVQMAQIWEAAGGTILSGSPNGGTPASGALVLKDDTANRSVTTMMYMLPPRPITYGGGQQAAYLLPLVDLRYFWQWIDVGDVSDVTSWSDLISAIGTLLAPFGGLTAGSISSDYGVPDAEMLRSYSNAAVLLDVVAESVGMRTVCKPDGSVVLQAGGDAGSAATQQTAMPVLAGDMPKKMRASILPPKVRVAFPVYYYHSREDSNGYFYVDTDVGTSGDGKKDGSQSDESILTVFTTAAALYKKAVYPPDTSADPENVTEVNALAKVIADAYAAFAADSYDMTFVGVNDQWTANGLDDYLWFHIGHQLTADVKGSDKGDENELDNPTLGDYVFYTRVASLPPNFGQPMQFQQFTDGWPYPLPLWFKIKTAFSSYTATANPGEWDKSSGGTLTADETADVTLTDTTHQCTAGVGKWVQARPIESSAGKIWEVVAQPGSGVRICRAQAKITSGHNLTVVDHVTPIDNSESPVSSPTEELEVTYDNGNYTTDDDTWGFILYDSVDGKWKPFEFPCSTG